MLAVLPIGWSHTMWWCQLVHRGLLEQEAGFDVSAFLTDKTRARSVAKAVWTVHVDNDLVFASDKAAVECRRNGDRLRR